MISEKRSALVAFALLLLGVLCLRPGYIVPDALATWSWLRSLVFDGDLLFFNEWGSMGLIREGFPFFKEVTATGALANHWWIGSTWVGLVPYLAAHSVALSSGGLLGEGGMGGIYAWTLAWLSVACLWIVWKSSDRILGGGSSITALVVVVIGTPLYWYTFRFPTLSHLPAAAAVAVLCWCVWRMKTDDSRWIEVSAGLALGLASAIRLQNALLIIPLILALHMLKRPARSRIYVAIGVAPFAIMQAVAWYAVYGHVLGPLVRGVDPAGGTWAPFRSPAFLEVLVSPWNGLFFWAPVTMLSLAGWFLALRDSRNREAADSDAVVPAMFIVMFAVQWLANGAFDRWWWGGLSFGPRRWIDLALPFAIGVGWCLRRIPAARIAAAIAAVWGLLLIAAAESGGLDLSGPVRARDVTAAIASTDWSVFFRATFVPAIPSPVAALMLVMAAAIVSCWVLVLSKLAARPALATGVAVASAVALTLWISAVIPATRERASFFHQAFAIRADRAELGALIDRKNLMEREFSWLEMKGSPRAQEVSRELAALEQVIASRLR